MIEYINFILLATTFSAILYVGFRLKKYLTLIIMTEALIDNIIDIPGEDDSKKQKLLKCVLTGNSKLYLGKIYSEEQINKLNAEEIEKLYSIYEAKLSGQMVKSLGKSLIHIYPIAACAGLGINDQDALSNDLENDPFLNSALQRFTCDLYYRFGSFLAPLSVGIITGRHYINEKTLSGVINNGRGTESDPSDN